MLSFPEESPQIKSSLLALAPELQIDLCEQLDKDTSTCLGLTCKAFYLIHRRIHGPTGEETEMAWDEDKTKEDHKADEKSKLAFLAIERGSLMPRLLKEFMDPDRVFEARIACQFVTHERYLILTKAYQTFYDFYDHCLRLGSRSPTERHLMIEKLSKSNSMHYGLSKAMSLWP